MNSDLFPAFGVVLDYWIETFLLFTFFREEPLDHLVFKQVLLFQAENFESLLLRHKFAADSEALDGYFSAAIPFEFVWTPNVLFLPKLAHLLQSRNFRCWFNWELFIRLIVDPNLLDKVSSIVLRAYPLLLLLCFHSYHVHYLRAIWMITLSTKAWNGFALFVISRISLHALAEKLVFAGYLFWY